MKNPKPSSPLLTPKPAPTSEKAGARFRNDEWTLEIEALGHQGFVENLRQMILLAEPPFSLGIYGRWGSGKTSIMRYLMAGLGGKPLEAITPYHEKAFGELKGAMLDKWNQISGQSSVKDSEQIVRTVWFNLWQHQNNEQPVAALLQEIVSQLSAFEIAKRKGHKILDVTFRSGIDILSELIKLTSEIPKEIKIPVGSTIQKLGETYESENLLNISNSQRLKLYFDQAVQKLLKIKKVDIESNARLVIFIDDLDRCEANQAISLLEAIKLYLSTHHCIFVLGMDPYHVERALQQVHKRSYQECHEYLEKLFQSIVRIPISNQYSDYIYKMLINGFRIFTPLDSHAEAKSHGKQLAQILEPNPRKVKNFVNSLRLFYEINDKTGHEEKLNFEKFYLIHYLRMYYSDVYTLLEHNPKLMPNIIDAMTGNLGKERVDAFLFHAFKNVLADKASKQNQQIDPVGLEVSPSSQENAATGNKQNSFLSEDEYEKLRPDIHYFDRRDQFKDLFINVFTKHEPELLYPYLLVNI